VNHHFRKCRPGKKSKTLVDKILKTTQFRISGSFLSFSVKKNKFSGSVELPEKFDIPLPVQLSKKVVVGGDVVVDVVGASKSGDANPSFSQQDADVKSPELVDLASPKKKTDDPKEPSRRKSKSESGKKTRVKKRGRKKSAAMRESPGNKADKEESSDSEIIILFEDKDPKVVKRKAAVDSEVVVPPQKRRKLNDSGSWTHESPDASRRFEPKSLSETKAGSETTKQRKALKTVDPNQKSILSYFFSATSPVS